MVGKAELAAEAALDAFFALEQSYVELEFFCAILLAVSENRAKSLAVMEDFLADMKKASEGMQ